MARRYKVLAGTHVEGGREFTRDQVVESEADLVSLFPHKFQDLGVVPSPAPAPQPATAPLGPSPDPERRRSSPPLRASKKT